MQAQSPRTCGPCVQGVLTAALLISVVIVVVVSRSSCCRPHTICRWLLIVVPGRRLQSSSEFCSAMATTRAAKSIWVRVHVIGNARIENVGNYQSCMVSKVPYYSPACSKSAQSRKCAQTRHRGRGPSREPAQKSPCALSPTAPSQHNSHGCIFDGRY